jgi:hypothetical protein
MKIAAQFATLMFALVASVQGQQIASVDLTHLQVESNSVAKSEKPPLPAGCTELGGGIGDGAIVQQRNQPRELIVEIMSLSKNDLSIGTTFDAGVRLRNSGADPVRIPWSVDPGITEISQNPDHLEWEVGSFKFFLDRNDLLKSKGQSLYGSEFSKGSMLTIRPGEWIAAMVQVRLELEYPLRDEIVRSGKRKLRVEWEQARHTKTLDQKKCELWSGYFKYNIYKQQNPEIPITITKGRSRDQ